MLGARQAATCDVLEPTGTSPDRLTAQENTSWEGVALLQLGGVGGCGLGRMSSTGEHKDEDESSGDDDCSALQDDEVEFCDVIFLMLNFELEVL